MPEIIHNACAPGKCPKIVRNKSAYGEEMKEVSARKKNHKHKGEQKAGYGIKEHKSATGPHIKFAAVAGGLAHAKGNANAVDQ